MSANSPNVSVFDEFVDGYEAACARGLSLSGESRDYFAQQRILHTKRLALGRAEVRTLVDFGCGLGHATSYLRESFERARIVGFDTSTGAIEAARRRYGSDTVAFTTDVRTGVAQRSVDLVYSNGTFHHIEPCDRPHVVRTIFDWLAPGGLFALWENNPWNPGTRCVMKRIPFDRDAQTLSYVVTERLLMAAGFGIAGTSFHFYFPGWMKMFRAMEPRLQNIPLGAQYCVLARKPAVTVIQRQR